jgi:hypothetical protein
VPPEYANVPVLNGAETFFALYWFHFHLVFETRVDVFKNIFVNFMTILANAVCPLHFNQDFLGFVFCFLD